MTKSIIYLNLFLILFSGCSDAFIADQIADNYSFGVLNYPSLEIEEELKNVEVSRSSNGNITIDLGTSLGVLEGTISDDAELTIQSHQGTSLSGILLDLPSGVGEFYISELDNGKLKNIRIRFQSPIEKRNICFLSLYSNLN